MDDTAQTNSITPATRRSLARQLIAWFGRSARDLPWRRTSDLYAIWISEVMLQQTQVATVVPYYARFLQAFPTVADLAAADEQQVLRLWEGLGYYRRARQLHAAARQIVALHAGQFPTTYEAVRSLPGIGRYTAGAILSIGLDQRLPILEANTIRLHSRLAGFRGDPGSTAGQQRLWKQAEELLPAKDAGTFNQALMELGSQICTPKAPACEQCPISAHCRAFAERIQEQIPAVRKRMQFEEVTEIAVIVRRGTKVLLRQCQAGERWAGLWDFPRFAAESINGHAAAPPAEQIATRLVELSGVRVAPGKLLTTLKHGVTRFRITLECYEAKYLAAARRGKSSAQTPTAWVLPTELGDYPLSTTGRKIGNLLAGK